MRIEPLIKEIRKSKGITLRELEKKTGISNGYLSEIENGRKIPNYLKALIIAKALKVDLNDIYKIIW